MLTATVSGSFHRHLHAITAAVSELTDLGVKVLSPADPRIVDSVGDFLFVASDRVRSVRMVQDRHIESIRSSNFLWLVAPDGYVGQSASMEVGFAVANEVPILADSLPYDLTLRQYVCQVKNLREVLQRTSKRARTRKQGFLIDPHASTEEAHDLLTQLDYTFARAKTRDPEISERRTLRAVSRLRDILVV